MELNIKTNQSLVEFWQTAHTVQNIKLISDYPGTTVWTFLKVNPSTGQQVLNVGIGTGRCTRDLSKRGCIVSVLDISQIAIDHVSNIVAAAFLAGDLSAIPNNQYDLIINHLVIQHMTNGDFLEQTKQLYRALKPGGTYAFQTAYRLNNIEDLKDQQIQLESLKGGGVCRSETSIKKMLNEYSDLSMVNDIKFKEAGWNAWHIVKKS